MSKLNSTWTVQPHGPLEVVDEGLLSAEGSIVMPLGSFPRRMTVVALRGGGTAVWSAIPLAEPEMAKIEALGPVRFLIVPNAHHRLDIGPWAKRYPGAEVIAPPRAEAAVREAAPVSASSDIVKEHALHLELVPGLKEDEFALTVHRRDGATLILNDILAHVRHPKGIGAKIMARVFGFGVKRPRTARTVRRMMVADGDAVAAKFRMWAFIPDLQRIIVSHGDIITEQPKAALLRAADDYI